MCLFQFWFPQVICQGVGLLGHVVVLFLVFLRNLHIIFHSDCINFIPTHSAKAFPFVQQKGIPFQRLFFVNFLMMAILTSVR